VGEANHIAIFVGRLINDGRKNHDLLRDAAEALEAVMENGL
jgi:hypothetical protein